MGTLRKIFLDPDEKIYGEERRGKRLRGYMNEWMKKTKQDSIQVGAPP